MNQLSQPLRKLVARALQLGIVFKISILMLSMVTLLLSQSSHALATSITHSKVVSANPVNFTPNVNQGSVDKLLQVGNIMVAGGNFKTVTHGGATVNRTNLMTFNATTGALTSFAPKLDGPVWGLTNVGNSIYVGGEFRTVNGVPMRSVAKFNLKTGKLDTAFKSPLAWGKVREVAVARNQLIIGGLIPGGLMSANLTTGKKTTYINTPIAGSISQTATDTRIYRFAVNPAQTRLVAIGNFTSVAGQKRYRAFMLNLDAAKASLSSWYYKPLEDMCRSTGTPEYLRDVDFDPTGSYFVIVASGWVAQPGKIGRSLCDVAARFDTNVLTPSKPRWMAHTGGDTLHSVAIAGSVIYLQGHNRWLNNSQGVDSAGPGAVSRPGVGAISPGNGQALAWNPGKQRGVGGKDILVTDKGVWIASDTDLVAGEYRKRIAFFPL